jgi:hypothetical protein
MPCKHYNNKIYLDKAKFGLQIIVYLYRYVRPTL